MWLNGVRNKLASNVRTIDEGQCGWISPKQNQFEYKTPGVVYSGRCSHPTAFLCFKRSFINIVPFPSTATFMSTVKKVSEEMSFTAKPDSAYSTSSPSNIGLSDSIDRTSPNGLLVGGIAAVTVSMLMIVGILACMKYKNGQFASGSTKIEIENSLYGKQEENRADNERTTPQIEESDASPYGVTIIQQDLLHEVSGEQRFCNEIVTSGNELCDVSPYDIATIHNFPLRDNSTTVHKYRQSDGNDIEKNQTYMGQTESLDPKYKRSVIPFATDLGEAVVYSQVNKSKST